MAENEQPKDTDAKKEKAGKPSMSRRQMKARIHELNTEYRELAMEARDGQSGAVARRSEISRELRALSTTLYLTEKDVDVTVPRSVTGHPFRIGDAEFWPGRHTVKTSVAQVLLKMIHDNREAELNRLRSNGEEVDLGAIGDKAVQVERSL